MSAPNTVVVEGRRLLDAIGSATQSRDEAPALAELVMPEFRIAEIHLAYEDSEDRITIGLIPTTDDVEGVEFVVSTSGVAAVLEGAQRAVEGGRPPCPRCGLAMDPDGHHCPATNGDLRGHRP